MIFYTHNVRTKWREQSDGSWTPEDTKAKQAWAASTGRVPRSKADVQGLVDRYSPESKPQDVTRTESEGTLTMKQLLRAVGGISPSATITWQGKKYNSIDFWTAIAFAESSGDAKVVNSIGATGLFQILISQHPQYTTEKMKDPAENVRAAKAISGNWTNPKPWETATNGDFADYLGKDFPVLGNSNSMGGGSPDTVLQSVGKTAKDTYATLAGFATILFDPSTWFRAGKVLLGGIIILIVVYMAIRSAL